MTGMKDLFGDRLYEQRRPTPTQLRDEGLALVKENSEEDGNWFGRALMVIAAIPHGWTGTAEDIRLDFLDVQLEQPHSVKVYGSLTTQAIRHHLIVLTGERRQMRGPKSNARKTDVYRRL